MTRCVPANVAVGKSSASLEQHLRGITVHVSLDAIGPIDLTGELLGVASTGSGIEILEVLLDEISTSARALADECRFKMTGLRPRRK